MTAGAYRPATEEELDLVLDGLAFYCRTVTDVDEEYLGIYDLYRRIMEGGLMLPVEEAH